MDKTLDTTLVEDKRNRAINNYYAEIHKIASAWLPPTTIGRFFYLKRNIIHKMVSIYETDYLLKEEISKYKITGHFTIPTEIILDCWEIVLMEIGNLYWTSILCTNACPFCVYYKLNPNKGCEFCDWGKTNGFCREETSVWRILNTSLTVISSSTLKKKYIKKYNK